MTTEREMYAKGEAHGRAGQAGGWLFEPTFNRSIKLRRSFLYITSDTRALLLREADHRLGLTADLAAGLVDPRRVCWSGDSCAA